MTTSMRSRPASAKHSIERPAGVVRVHTVFGRSVSVAGGIAQGVTSFAGPGSLGISVGKMLILLAEMGGAVSCLSLEGNASHLRYTRVGTCKSEACTVLNSFSGN